MMRPVWAGIANHYTKRRGPDAPYVTRIAAKAAPEGGGGDYGPNSGGYDHLGFGTPAFTRDRATAAGTTASPTPASASGAGGATQSPAADAQGRRGTDLANTGSSEVPVWTAAAGVTAVAGGLLLLRRRGRAKSDGA